MRLLERYEIFEVNEGGFGYVLGLSDLRTGERIAAKIPKDHYTGASGVDEFTEEVAIWIDLPAHENIVTARFVRLGRGTHVIGQRRFFGRSGGFGKILDDGVHGLSVRPAQRDARAGSVTGWPRHDAPRNCCIYLSLSGTLQQGEIFPMCMARLLVGSRTRGRDHYSPWPSHPYIVHKRQDTINSVSANHVE